MKKSILLPENISEITLGQYQKLHEIEQKDISDVEKLYNKVMAMTGMIREEVEAMKQVDILAINQQVDKAVDTQAEFKNRFYLGDTEFGMIPNFDKITSKEYIDLSSYGYEPETLHNVMAILFRPIIDKGINGTYIIEDYNGTEQYANIMKSTPMSQVNSVLAFFLTLLKELKSYSLRSMKVGQVKKRA